MNATLAPKTYILLYISGSHKSAVGIIIPMVAVNSALD